MDILLGKADLTAIFTLLFNRSRPPRLKGFGLWKQTTVAQCKNGRKEISCIHIAYIISEYIIETTFLSDNFSFCKVNLLSVLLQNPVAIHYVKVMSP